MRELKIDEIINKTIKEFRDYEFIIVDGDDWGQWQINMVGRLLKPLDVGDIKVRDKDDEVWKDKVAKSRSSKKVE